MNIYQYRPSGQARQLWTALLWLVTLLGGPSLNKSPAGLFVWLLVLSLLAGYIAWTAPDVVKNYPGLSCMFISVLVSWAAAGAPVSGALWVLGWLGALAGAAVARPDIPQAALLYACSAWIVPENRNIHGGIYFLYSLAAPGVYGLAVWASGSRAALVGWLAYILPARISYKVLGALVLAGLVFWIRPDNALARLSYWAQAGPHLAGAGWVGYGPGAAYALIRDPGGGYPTHAHNLVIQVYLETGIMGLAAWGVLLWELRRSPAVVVGLLAAGMFDISFVLTPGALFLFGAVTNIADPLAKKTNIDYS